LTALLLTKVTFSRNNNYQEFTVMATKVIRTCDRLGCAIDTAPFVPGEELPSYGTVGYTVLKTVTDEKGKTTTVQLADFDEVCADCSDAIEDLVLRIKGEKRAGRPRKVAADTEDVPGVVEAAAPEKTRKKPGPKPGSKRRGRRTNAQIAADKAAAEAAEKGGDEPVDIPATVDPDPEDVLHRAAAAVRKGVAGLPPEEEKTAEDETDTFETDSGEIVNADTGEVLASPVEGEENDSEDANSFQIDHTGSNGSSMKHAHPF
jgi:hypothetical protein